MICQLVDGASKLAGVIQEDGNGSRSHTAGNGQQTADAGDKGKAQIVEHVHAGTHNAGKDLSFNSSQPEALIALLKLCYGLLFPAKHFDDPLAGDGLLNTAIQVS